MKLRIYIMTPERISTAASICVCISILSLLGKGSVKCILSLLGNGSVNMLTWQRIHATIELLDPCVCVTPQPLLGDNSVKTFPRQRTIVGGVVFSAFHLVSNESKALVFPRTSCFFFVFVCGHFIIGLRAVNLHANKQELNWSLIYCVCTEEFSPLFVLLSQTFQTMGHVDHKMQQLKFRIPDRIFPHQNNINFIAILWKKYRITSTCRCSSKSVYITTSIVHLPHNVIMWDIIYMHKTSKSVPWNISSLDFWGLFYSTISCRVLWKQQWTLAFYKKRGISLLMSKY
jgi:hypothetical protein